MVHILHLDRPYRRVRHVVITGPRRVSRDLLERRHAEGKVHGLLAAVLAEQIPFRVGRTFDGERERARALSRRSHRAELCAICAREKVSA